METSSAEPATAMPSASRPIPAYRLMRRCNAGRAATGTTGTGPGRASPLGSRPAPRSAATASAARRPITRPSSRLFDASRLAPCSPVRATSPAAYRPSTSVRPWVSVTTPPHAKCAAGTTGIGSRSGSIPAAAHAAATVGNRAANPAMPVASR